MQRLSAKLFFILMTAAIVAACGNKGDTPAGAQNKTANKPSIVLLGDSLTAGYQLPIEQAYPAIIQNKIDGLGKNIRIINAGVSGDTTADGLTRVGFYLKPELNVKLVVISLGSNDSMRGYPLAVIEKNLKATIDKIRAFDANIEIAVTRLQTFPNLGKKYGGGYKALFGKVAKQKNVKLFSFLLAGVAGKKKLNLPDGIHPTAEGQKILAQNVWKDLEPYVQKL